MASLGSWFARRSSQRNERHEENRLAKQRVGPPSTWQKLLRILSVTVIVAVVVVVLSGANSVWWVSLMLIDLLIVLAMRFVEQKRLAAIRTKKSAEGN